MKSFKRLPVEVKLKLAPYFTHDIGLTHVWLFGCRHRNKVGQRYLNSSELKRLWEDFPWKEWFGNSRTPEPTAVKGNIRPLKHVLEA